MVMPTIDVRKGEYMKLFAKASIKILKKCKKTTYLMNDHDLICSL